MGLNIKNAEAERLIEELASLEGRSKTAAVAEAVREKLARMRLNKDFVADVLKIADDCASRLTPEARALDHGEYLYDEMGLPR